MIVVAKGQIIEGPSPSLTAQFWPGIRNEREAIAGRPQSGQSQSVLIGV